MEKRKLLLVAISVGVFLAITIGAAIFVFTPKNADFQSGSSGSRYASSAPASITVSPPPALDAAEPASRYAALDAVDLVRNPEDVPGLKPVPEGTAAQGSDFYVNGAAPSEYGTLISVSRPSTAAVPNAAPAGRAVSAASGAPSDRSTATATATTAVPARAAPKPTAETRPAARVHDDYWVQTGAFSTLARAEGVKETLSSKGITALIENREVDGKTLFRVRVGPYTSQNEADYWLSLVKSINGFEDSQVRQTQSRR